MKKIVLVVFLIFAAAIAGILLSSYDLSNLNTDDNPTRVGLLLSGSRSDCSYNQAHYEALGITASACVGCKGCETRCPFGVGIAERMKKTAELFGR